MLCDASARQFQQTRWKIASLMEPVPLFLKRKNTFSTRSAPAHGERRWSLYTLERGMASTVK